MPMINPQHFSLFLIVLLTSSVNFAVFSYTAALASQPTEIEFKCDVLTVDLSNSPELEWKNISAGIDNRGAPNTGDKGLDQLGRRPQPTWKVSEPPCLQEEKLQILTAD